MNYPKTGISVQRLARDLGTMLGDFTGQVDALLAQPGVESSVTVPEIRREVCIAVWAAITAAFEASALSRDEKDRLAVLLRDHLVPAWQKHCASDPEVARAIPELASRYVEGRDPRSQVATATHIVRRLLDAIGAAGEQKRKFTRTLIPLFAHRMLGDTYHLNDLKTRFGLQLIATLCLTAGLTQAFEPALRMLRLA
jgi:hypothetical protein